MQYSLYDDNINFFNFYANIKINVTGDGKWNSQAGIKFMSKTPFSERIMNEQRTLNQFSYERSQLSTFTSNENLILQD